MAQAEYIASTIPAATIYASFTTLFTIAEQQFNDALRWVELAEINDLIDPWLFNITPILIPPVLSSATPDGILGEFTPTPIAVTPPPPVTYPFIAAPPAIPYVNSNGAMAVDPRGNLIV